MWCLVMFDLPVKTKQQRSAATEFRNMLLDMGYGMVQYSVYARYTPTQAGNRATVKAIRNALPSHGYVRILHISDHQWSSALRFANLELENNEEPPSCLRFSERRIRCKAQKMAPLSRLSKSIKRGEY